MNAITKHHRHPLKAAIVDLDGTMVDTVGDFDAALNAAFADLGLPAVPRAFIEHTIGKGSENLIRRTLAHVGAGEARFEAAMAGYQAHYLAINGAHAAVYAGVEAGLRRLRDRGLKLACLTNKPGAFAKPLLDAKGLGHYFACVHGGDAFARKKPDPLPLLETCRVLGTATHETLMIGDSSNDAAAARAAGCPVWLVSYGYNHGEPVHGVDADGVVDRLDLVPLD